MKKNIWLGWIMVLVACQPKEPTDPGSLQRTDLKSKPQVGSLMLQPFYWDVEPRTGWWKVITPKLNDWAALGIDKIWLPPVSKGMSGSFSMGYDPMDYYDLGEYDQMGTTPTRFGTRSELETLIRSAHQLKMQVIADIVLNHNSGGSLEFNPYRNKNTYTRFEPKSGKFPRNFEDFHPNARRASDEGALFFPEQDLSHVQPNVRRWLWESEESVAQYYKKVMGFDGWRFDYVLGFSPEVVTEWMKSVGGFGVAELWDGNPDVLERYAKTTGIHLFDFSTFYALENALDGNNLQILRERNTLLKRLPNQSVTFVSNHDTEKETNPGNRITQKRLAYAYLLTHEGIPCIFYNDLENTIPRREWEKLILIYKTLARGNTGILHTDRERYIAARQGDGTSPGLVVFLNNGNSELTQSVITPWKNATLVDYAENIPQEVKTDANGRVTLPAPAKSYTIWSRKNF